MHLTIKYIVFTDGEERKERGKGGGELKEGEKREGRGEKRKEKGQKPWMWVRRGGEVRGQKCMHG